MKKMLGIVLAFAMTFALCACGQTETAPPAPTAEPLPASEPALAPTAEPALAPTAEPTLAPTAEPTQDPGEAAKVLVPKAPLVGEYLRRGDRVTVVDEQNGYYAVLRNDIALCVEKRFIRLDGEEAFVEKSGYAKESCEAYVNHALRGDTAFALVFNQEVTLLEELGGVYLVESDGKQGYVDAAHISLYPAQSHSGGGNSGSGGADGDDIPVHGLAAVGEMPRRVFLSANPYPAEGTVLCDGVEAMIALLDRGEAVGILADEANGMSRILWNGLIGLIQTRFVRLDSEKAPEPWAAYARAGCTAYPTWHLTGEGQSIKQNTPLTVLEDLGDCRLAELSGELLYIATDMLSDVETPIYHGGGNTGGGSSGGDIWTAPML